MTRLRFKCEACGATFPRVDGWNPEEEMQAAFPEGIPEEERAEVCDDCWRGMREAFPSLDARYKLEGR